MSWTNWACFGVLLLGFVLFLYGANYYDAAVGYTGVFLFLVGLVAILTLYIYGELTKKKPQNP
jgi:membrane-bound ClpP family serine protease